MTEARAVGDRQRPQSVEVLQVLSWDPAADEVVVQLRGWEVLPDPLVPIRKIRLWRFVVRQGAIVEAWLNGRVVSLAEVPGLVRDLARTAALDASGLLRRGWRISPGRPA